MAKLYLVRHAESVANTKGIYQGQTYDTPLSVLGKKQAERLAKLFINLDLDRVITSPLKRTMQTANGVAKSKKMKVIKALEIIETNHGKWEGLSKNKIEKMWPDVYKKWYTTPASTTFPEGESFKDVQKRSIDWFKKEIKFKGNTLLVTHDNIIRIMITHILKTKLDSIWEINLNPAGVTEIEFNKGKIKINYINKVDHLSDLNNNIALHAL